jgi:hypothetical protein
MKIPFVGASNTARSLSSSAERTVNAYLEYQKQGDGVSRPVALYGTPGLLLRLTLGASPVRQAIRAGSFVYWVAGNTVYRMDSSYAATSCGTIGTSSGAVSMAWNGTQVLIVDGLAGWIVTGTALAQIVDVDFPNGVTAATCQDGFFLVAGDGSGRLYWNETPNAGTNWNGLDFSTAEGNPDNTVGLVSNHREVWIPGTETTEIFIATGDADALFARSGNAYLQQGTVSGRTVQPMNNTVYWLGAGKDGQGIVFRAEGYNPIRISDHALEEAIRGYSTISDAYAFTFQIVGHSFYALTFPTADATWLYDAATDKWYEWAWRDSSDNTLHRHRASCCVFFNGEHLVGDWETGEVYALDLDTYTDNGDLIQRIRRTQTLRSDKRLFFGLGTIDMESAVANASYPDPKVMLRYSDDDGRTWSNEKQLSLGAVGEYGKRVRIPPTGSTKPGRGRVWELSMTDGVKFALFGADVDVEAGA